MVAKASNPYSTGGGGTNFEIKVLSSFLTTMLCGAPCPCFPSSNIKSLRLQSKQAGFDTDDVLVVTQNKRGEEFKLLGQIKHNLVFVESNETFKEVLQSAWNDFSDIENFDKQKDAIALITGPQSARTINNVRRVLEWARHSASDTEFFAKIASEDFSSQAKRSFVSSVGSVIRDFSSDNVTDADLWCFFKKLHLFSYDFDIQHSQDEARFINLIKISKSSNSSHEPSLLWSQISLFLSTYNENAGTISKNDLDKILPETISESLLLELSARSSEAVKRLLEHSALTLQGIKTTLIEDIKIPRDNLMQEALEALETSQVLLLTSEAGGGKSAMAKNIANALEVNGPVFAFRVEIFNYAHIHQALHSIGITSELSDLSASFGLLPNRVIFIDSVERLLEMSDQQAFIQLLSMVAKNRSWKIILTCRSYAENWFVTQVLASASLQPSVIKIPHLTDSEISSVAECVPDLKAHLSNNQLLDVLRNPFFLSIACRSFPKKLEGNNDRNQKDLRRILWQEAVTRPSVIKGGMPNRREKIFLLISTKRAKLMQPYVRIDTEDYEALDALISDGVVKKTDGNYLTPAHDLFEDLSIESFIQSSYEELAADKKAFFQKIGPEPAMRRAFRHWALESLSSDDVNLKDFVKDVAIEKDLEQFWTDEILVAILLSENADTLIKNLSASLLNEKKALLFRAIHLLKTACKEPNYDLIEQMGLSNKVRFSAVLFHFMRPSGAGWSAVIKFIAQNIAQFELEEAGMIEGLLREWTSTLDVNAELDESMINTSKIALSYYRKIRAEDSWSHGIEKEFLKIILKIPNAQPEVIRGLYKNAVNADTHSNRQLLEYAVKSFDCFSLCKHIPDVVIDSVMSLSRPRKMRRGRMDFGDDDFSAGTEGFFGLGRTFSFRCFPPSANQGPFFFLLQLHPEQGLSFVIDFVNTAIEKYAQSSLDGQIEKTTLVISDDKTREIFISDRLWGLYRGTTVGPDFLVSSLMALEAWLLKKAKDGEDLSEIAETIYQSSNSVAFISILVSVATAYPEALKDSILPLLSNFHFYKLDKVRMARETGHLSDMRSAMGFPETGIENIHYDQRKDSDALPHRSEELEQLVAKLQFTEFRPQIFNLIDEMKLKHFEVENEQQQILNRLVFKRIDVREWEVVGEAENGVLIGPKVEEPELKTVVEKTEKQTKELGRWAKLSNWARDEFDGKSHGDNSFENWNEALVEAKELYKAPKNEDNYFHMTNPIAYAASCFIKNYRNELSTEDLEWCCQVLSGAILENAGAKDTIEWVQKNPSHGSRPAAFVLPLLIDSWKKDPKKNTQQLKRLLAEALHHKVREISEYSIIGIKNYLWDLDKEFAKRCFQSLLLKGVNVEKLYSQTQPYTEIRTQKFENCFNKTKKVLLAEKKEILLPEISLSNTSREFLLQALCIVPTDHIDEYYIQVISKIMSELVEAISQEDRDRSNRTRLAHNYEFNYSLYRIYAEIMFVCSEDDLDTLMKPLIHALDHATKAAEELMQNIIRVADLQNTHDRFWLIWKPISENLFADTGNTWRKGDLVKILLFANVYWKKDVKSWSPLEENKGFITQAFSSVGHTEAGFFALTKLMSGVGAFMLPEAIIDLSSSYQKADKNLLKERDVKTELELVLRNAVFLHGSTIRQREKLREACIYLLDELVNSGSSISFQLRELLIAPIRDKAA